MNSGKNKISTILGIDKIKNITKLLLEDNQITVFPICSLSKLKILNISGNSLHDVGPVFNSELPCLQQLSIVSNNFSLNKYSKILGKDFTMSFTNLRSFNCDYYFDKILI